tara:strand:+ start:61 stop:315 length:255 start_codon:yes stop_codon:yes gene_type:complete
VDGIYKPMLKEFKELLTNHIRSVDETYFEHMYNSFAFSIIFALSAVILIIHGVFPFLFKTTASDLVLNRLKKNRPNLFGSGGNK